MKKTFLLIAISAVFALGVFAQGPNGSATYYAGADGKKGSALKTALSGIISKHTQLSYTPGVWDGIEKVDIRDDGYILDRYSNITNYTKVKDRAGNYSGEGDCYNREHSFPASWFNDDAPMYTDLMHLVASDGKVNGNRGNRPFGETNGGKNNSANNYSKIGKCTTEGYTGSEDVFEPNDEWKGDFAR
ncbi:MAG: endonuclease, partial [Prevotella sp.]|nr:endonuclease [Prevotella sp.]